MPCNNCFDNCEEIQFDKCVKYTGEDIPLLGICNGDTLYEFEQIIINKLLSYTDGSGITLSNITIGCQFLNDILGGKDKTLANLVQMLVDANCSLKTLIDQIQQAINPSISFNTSCLTVPANPTKDQILQAAINKICELNARVTAIESDYVKASQLNSLIQQYLNSQTSPSDNQSYKKMVPYVAYPYHGSLSNFDNSGAGLAAAGFDKVYLCIGQAVNGFLLPDYRGRSPLGANTNVPTSGMDASVDPSQAANAGYSVALNQKIGSYTTTLTVDQLAAHSHPVNDPGHSHSIPASFASVGDDNNWNLLHDSGSTNTNKALTGITIGSAGGNQPHNNTHPSVGANFIMYIP